MFVVPYRTNRKKPCTLAVRCRTPWTRIRPVWAYWTTPSWNRCSIRSLRRSLIRSSISSSVIITTGKALWNLRCSFGRLLTGLLCIHCHSYHDVGTPCSSLSPASSGPLQSPASYSIPQDHPVGSPSPPPTTQDFTEFLQSSNATVRPFEADFSNLKLNGEAHFVHYQKLNKYWTNFLANYYRSWAAWAVRGGQMHPEGVPIVQGAQEPHGGAGQGAYGRRRNTELLPAVQAVRVLPADDAGCPRHPERLSVVLWEQAVQKVANRPTAAAACDEQRGGQGVRPVSRDVLPELPQRAEAATIASAATAEQSARWFRLEGTESVGSPEVSGLSGDSERAVAVTQAILICFSFISSRRTYSQRTQNQAARKIQQFMRQSKNK